MSFDIQKRLFSSQNLKQNWALCLFPYLGLVFLHIILGLKMQQPIIFADEVGYLGVARYFAGVSHLPQGIQLYHFGYSLFLLPAFWLFSDPISAYRAAIVINSLLLSSLYISIYFLLHRFFECGKKLSFLIAFITCLYPAFLLQSNIAWSENAFIPCFSFFIISFGLLIDKKSYLMALVFGFLTGFLFTIHPRALPILPTVVIYLLVLAFLAKIPKTKIILSILVIFTVYLLTGSINEHLTTFYGKASFSAPAPIKAYLSKLLSLSNIVSLSLSAAGQLLYLCQATCGLFLIATAYVCLTIHRKWSSLHRFALNDIQFNVILLFIIASSGIFLASSLQMIGEPERADHLIYGRYNEGFLALYIALALLAIRVEWAANSPKKLRPYLFALAIIVLALIAISNPDYDKVREITKPGSVNVINVLGVYPFLVLSGGLNLLVVSLISTAFFFMVIYAFRIKFSVGLWSIAIYFLFISACGYTVFYVRADNIKQVTTLARHVQSISDAKVVSYDVAFRDPESWYSYQYLLPDVVFKTFRSSRKQLPSSRVVISSRNWKQSKNLNARLVASENGNPETSSVILKLIQTFFKKPFVPGYRRDQTLWILPKNELTGTLVSQ
ncbi:MAG: hypothetical protein K9M96_07490 [Deltaproteobacteria bacterium]|nr:hypothetical protein [Deltaproteobacteria bacterium]